MNDMRRWLLPLSALMLLFAAAMAAEARMHAPYRGHRIVASATGTPPLDGFPVPTVAWSMRKLLASYSGPGVRLRRTADTVETDINFLGFTGSTGAPLDTVAMTSHCTATPGTCTVRTIYDQVGGGATRDAVQTITANQPAAIISCANNVPCHQLGITPQALIGGTFTPATGVATISIVANRSSGTGNCAFARENGTSGQRVTGGAANTWVMSAGGGTISASPTPSDAQWHVATAVFNGAASKFVIDGTTYGPVAITPVVTAGGITMGVGGSAGTCRQTEVIIWDNVVLTDPQIAALQANQRNWLGLP